MILGILIAILIYVAINYYIGSRIINFINITIPHANHLIFWIIYGFIASLLIFSYIIPREGYEKIKNIVGILSNYWLGMFFYLLLFFVIFDLLIVVGKALRIINSPLGSNTVLLSGGIILVLTLVSVIYGRYNASDIKEVSYEVNLVKKQDISDLKIALISDVHLGYINEEKHIKKVVDEINDLNPDLVCIAGDIFDGDYSSIKNPDKISVLLKSIKSKYGTYASFGNHDAGDTYDSMKNFLEKSNIKLLEDEALVIDGRFILAGRRDSSPIGVHGQEREEKQEFSKNLDESYTVIVMDHQPSNIDEYEGVADLVLSGHTHKGQVFPFNLVTRAYFQSHYGKYQKSEDSPTLITSSGVGTWGPPMRLGSNNEVVDISVHFK